MYTQVCSSASRRTQWNGLILEETHQVLQKDVISVGTPNNHNSIFPLYAFLPQATEEK